MLSQPLCTLALFFVGYVTLGLATSSRRNISNKGTVISSEVGFDAPEPLREVYSIGDLHGDHERCRQLLQLLGLASFDEGVPRWTGNNSILVSTGDSVDRGEHGRAIYLDFKTLAEQATNYGGEVVNIMGNHELMNLQGDLRYVHPSEFALDGDYGGQFERYEEWSRFGVIGSDIRERYVAAAVREGILFVHGGLDPAILREYGVDNDPVDPLQRLNAEFRKLLDSDMVPYNHALVGARGPFWNRFFASNNADVCKKVEETLTMLKAKRMVVGHTPQLKGVGVRCTTDAGPRIILGDTVISRAYESAFGFSRPSAVQYHGDTVTALYLSEDEQNLDSVPLFTVSTQL